MTDARPAILSIAVLAVFALTAGGIRLLARRADRTRAVLMLVAAVVLLANVLLWAWPMPARAGPLLPAEVRAFAARQAACTHWRGEEPYDAARGREISSGVRRACAGLEHQRRRLRLRYRGDARIMAAIGRP